MEPAPAHSNKDCPMDLFRSARALTALAVVVAASACASDPLMTTGETATLTSATPSFLSAASVNFENPPYTLGTINGQDDWLSTGAGLGGFDHAVAANTYGYASFGAQSLRMSNAVTSGSFGDQTFSKRTFDWAGETTGDIGSWNAGGTRQTHFEAQWDFASTVPGAEQPGLHVVASADRGDGARMTWVQMQDTPTGLEVDFYDYQHAVGDFVYSTVATGLSRSVPHTIKMTIDFVDGIANDVVKIYVDGALLHTGTTWEDYFREGEGNPSRATLGKGFLIDNLGTTAFTGPPTNKDQCKGTAWQSFNTPRSFKNQGDCVSFVSNGK